MDFAPIIVQNRPPIDILRFTLFNGEDRPDQQGQLDHVTPNHRPSHTDEASLSFRIGWRCVWDWLLCQNRVTCFDNIVLDTTISCNGNRVISVYFVCFTINDVCVERGTQNLLKLRPLSDIDWPWWDRQLRWSVEEKIAKFQFELHEF